MKKLITIKISQEQLGLLATLLHRQIGELGGVNEILNDIGERDLDKDDAYEWVSICMSAIDSAQLAAYEKQCALKHLLKTIESTSKQTLAWNNDTQRMEVES